MEIASFGDAVFSVSSSLVRTISEYSYTGSARWAVHEIIGETCKAQFVGPGQGEITFAVLLLSDLGVTPRNEAEKLFKMMREGKYAPFIIGGQPVGEGDWYIEQLEQGEMMVNSSGEMRKILLTATLKEYF